MNNRTTLKKSLKPQWVWAIALGSAIGWGAFVQPVNWIAMAGPTGVIIGFSMGALLMMLIAVSYGFLIKTFPVSGGEFAYAFISLGRTHAFICGWFLTLGYICIVALNASALSLMMKYLFPFLVENLFLYQIAGWNVYATEIIISTLGLLVIGYLNIKGSEISGRIQFVFAIIMVTAVVLLTVAVGLHPSTSIDNMRPFFPENKGAFAAILSIVAIAPWAFVGFDAVPQAAEEFDFPARKAFRLIILALVFAAVIYSLMILSTAMASPWTETANQGYLWGTGIVVQQILGPIGLSVLTVALSMGIFTGLNGFTMTSSRLLFAMSRAKIIPAFFHTLHPKHRTPHTAIIFTISVSAIAPWFGREALVWVVDMSSVGVSIAYFYTCLTAFRLFTWSDDKRANTLIQEVAPFKKTIAFAGMIASLSFIALLLVPGSPAVLGNESKVVLIAWVLIGVVFYLFKRKEYNNLSNEELNFLILGHELNKEAS